jgi:Arc/MetJ-type ribon-helix-helix transcriptional regulator
MALITAPVSDKQKTFLEEMVKSGRAANKAHAVRMAIDAFAREEVLERIRRGREEVREKKTLKGDLDVLARRIG